LYHWPHYGKVNTQTLNVLSKSTFYQIYGYLLIFTSF
jgi:short-subunit dehydrogenase